MIKKRGEELSAEATPVKYPLERVNAFPTNSVKTGITPEIVAFLKEEVQENVSPEVWEHTQRVRGFAKRLCAEIGVDEQMAKLIDAAALLHDRTFSPQALRDRHVSGAEWVRGILTEMKVGKDSVERVAEMVYTHNTTVAKKIRPNTLEGKIARDAENLDLIEFHTKQGEQGNPRTVQRALEGLSTPQGLKIAKGLIEG